MILKVARREWNRVELAASTFGLDIAPDAPEGARTVVEIAGSWKKLQQLLNKIGAGPVLARVAERVALPNPYEELEGRDEPL
jgi:hypothetical protein